MDTYDLVITGGRVMDPETMYDDVANVAITDGRISVITKDEITGRETIDAEGLVVAPGFIDTHLHSVDPFATKMAVSGGVTTGMDLEAGASSIDDWYALREQSGWQVNFGTTVGIAFTRMLVLDPEVKIDEPLDAAIGGRYTNETAKDGVPGWSVTRSSLDQMNQIMQLYDEGLRQGAIGVGCVVAYAQMGVTSYELFETQRVAARYGRQASVHTRYHLNTQTPAEAQISFDEVLANAMVLRAPLLLAHDNDYGWWENEEKLQLAREQGYNVWGEYYPYGAGSTIIGAEFFKPELWEDVFGYRYEETIFDPGADRFLTKDEYLQKAKEQPGYTVIAFMPSREAWMKYWLNIPHMVVASDAMMGVDKDGNLLPWEADVTRYAGHPRTASSYAKTLRLGREHGVPLMFTLAQLSYWNAKHLGDTGLKAMRERGRVQEGKVADLTLFDPETVADRATFKAGVRWPRAARAGTPLHRSRRGRGSQRGLTPPCARTHGPRSARDPLELPQTRRDTDPGRAARPAAHHPGNRPAQSLTPGESTIHPPRGLGVHGARRHNAVPPTTGTPSCGGPDVRTVVAGLDGSPA